MLAYKIDFWWPLANEQVEKIYKDNLICKKTSWQKAGLVVLENCQNKKENFKAQKIVFNLFSGQLFLQNVWLKIVSGSSKGEAKFPNLPKQIQKIKIANLYLIWPETLKDILPNKVKDIELVRKNKAWQTQIDSSENLQIAGLIGDQVDLEAKFNNYYLKLKTLKSNLNGLVRLKTNHLFKEPLDVKLEKFEIFDHNLKTPIKLDGNFVLNSSFTQIESIKAPFKINFGNLKITNVLLDPLWFKLHKTSLHNLKPFIQNTNLPNGFLEADLKLNLAKPEKTLANLKFASVNLKQYNLQGLNGNLRFLPLITARAFAQNNLKQKKLKEVLSILKVQEFNLYIPYNQINFEQPSLKTKCGFQGKINFRENENLEGKIILKNLSAISPKQKIGIQNGQGIINLVNEKATLYLKAYNFQNSSEPLFVNGNLSLWPKPIGSFDLKTLHFSLYKNNISPQINSLKAHLQNIKAKVFYNQKPIVQSFSGQIKNIYIQTPQQNLQISDGKLNLTKNNILQIKDLLLKTPSGYANAQISLPILAKNFQPITQIKLKMPAQDIRSLLKPYLKPEYEQYKILGLAEGELKLNGKSLEKLNLHLNDFEIWQEEKELINSLNGQIHLNDKSQIFVKNLEGNFNQINKFQINGQFSQNNYLPTLSIHTLLNLKNISEFLQEKPSIAFDKEVYIPMSFNIKTISPKKLDLRFSSNFHKLQLSENKIVFAPEISQIENLVGHGNLNWKNKYFEIDDLIYSGKDFGILLKAFGNPDKFNFSFESAPLLDLGEIAKIWSENATSGQFRGKIIAKDFEPNDQSTWIKNLEAEMYSEEDVHDFEYGILYGKYFRFDLKTENGNGGLNLTTRKGKIKNLQITNLKSHLQIKDGMQAILQECSLETADGKASVTGSIDLSSGDSDLIGKMENVNIETISNNLFNNLGNYNGKANLNYNLQGNFISILKADPPKTAHGDFELKQGAMKQISELSKGLNLANLIFGLPVYFSFSTINHILEPEQDAEFLSIKGKWRFNNNQKKVLLQDTIYQGINALYLSLNGAWDFVEKDLNFDVYGFIPKRPTRLEANKAHKYSPLDFADKSRHFKFKVKGNIKNPDSITNSVKRSIKFLWFPDYGEVKQRFRNQRKTK